jgi:hypothetical protein
VELPTDVRGLRTIDSDGESLYLALWADTSELEPVGLQGIARLDPGTNELVMLATSESRPISIVVGERDVYWSTDTNDLSEDGTPRIMRTPKDGGPSQLLAAVTGGYVIEVAERDETVYWGVDCFADSEFTGRHLVSVRAR